MKTTTVDRILVPVDSSAGAHTALNLAATMASAMNLPINLVYAFPHDGVEMFGPLSEAPTEAQRKYMNPEAFEELRQKTSRKVFDDAKALLADHPDLQVDEIMVSGHPAEGILEHAETVENPMIVAGSRGLSTFKGILLGSVSQSLVHHAKCPVTVVR